MTSNGVGDDSEVDAGAAAGITAPGTTTSNDANGVCEVDPGLALMAVNDGTLDDAEKDLRVDVGVTLTRGVGLLEPGASFAMTRWRRSAIRSETDTLLAEGAILARDLCRC